MRQTKGFWAVPFFKNRWTHLLGHLHREEISGTKTPSNLMKKAKGELNLFGFGSQPSNRKHGTYFMTYVQQSHWLIAETNYWAWLPGSAFPTRVIRYHWDFCLTKTCCSVQRLRKLVEVWECVTQVHESELGAPFNSEFYENMSVQFSLQSVISQSLVVNLSSSENKSASTEIQFSDLGFAGLWFKSKK